MERKGKEAREKQEKEQGPMKIKLMADASLISCNSDTCLSMLDLTHCLGDHFEWHKKVNQGALLSK